MAVAFVTIRNVASTATANSVISTSATLTGANPCIVFDVGIHSTTVSVTAVTWELGGTPTRIKRQLSASGVATEIWGLAAAVTGSGSAVAHLSASATCLASLLLYTGTDPTTPFPAAGVVVSTSTAASVTLTPVGLGANDIGHGVCHNITGNVTVINTNHRLKDNASTPGMNIGDSAGTTPITFNTDGAMVLNFVSYVGIRIAATAAAAVAGWGPLLGLERNQHVI